MKKLYIVETSSAGNWEFNTGFHLVKAETEIEAKEMIKSEFGKTIHDKKIVSIKNIDEMLLNKEVATIIHSAEM